MNAFKELDPVLYGEDGIKYQEYLINAHNMCFAAHWHERAEFLHVVSGRLNVILDAEQITVTPGQIILIMPNMIHCGFAGEQGADYRMIAFDIKHFFNATAASDKYLLPFLRNEISFHIVTEYPEIVQVIKELEKMLNTGSDCHPLCTAGNIYELIGLLYRFCSTGPRTLYKQDERFCSVLEYINHHFTEDISSKDISQKFGYDETYFCRRFKKITGVTTMNYIRILRLELACRLLRTTQNDIRNIASECGFSDICYFSNCFKHHFGVSPTEYRLSIS